MQGKLNISSIYRFMLSVSHIEELDISSLCGTRVRGSFTSPLIHCILCFMWLGSSHLFSYKCMYAGGVNFMSLLFMNVISHISPYCLICFHPFVDELTKRERSIWRVYICMSLFSFMQKEGKEFGEFMHICVIWFMYFIEYHYVYCYT